MVLVPVHIYRKDEDDGGWRKEFSLVSYQSEPFAEGYYKKSYKASNCKLKNAKNVELVLKLGKTAPLSQEDAERDVEMQLECAQLAKKYNAMPVTPKKINVVEPHMVEILFGDHEGEFGLLERYIVGKYEKHNTSQRPGLELTDRNTPPAFTHFTWEATGMSKIVCDLQGVGDTLTDPQVISVQTNGQHAVDAMIRFFKFHRCNSICKSLGLQPINPQDIPENLIRTQPVPAGPLPSDWLKQLQGNFQRLQTLSEEGDSGLGEDRIELSFKE